MPTKGMVIASVGAVGIAMISINTSIWVGLGVWISIMAMLEADGGR